MGAILALLPSLIPAVTSLITYIGSIRTASQQSGEWTADMETAYHTMLQQAATAPEWQPDTVSATPVTTTSNPAPVTSIPIAAGSAVQQSLSSPLTSSK